MRTEDRNRTGRNPDTGIQQRMPSHRSQRPERERKAVQSRQRPSRERDPKSVRVKRPEKGVMFTIPSAEPVKKTDEIKIVPSGKTGNSVRRKEEVYSVVEESAATEVKTAVEEPAAEEIPAAAEEPAAELVPAAAEEPVAEAVPAAAEEPAAEAVPAAAEEPAAEAVPAAAEEPVAEAVPAAAEEPVAEEPTAEAVPAAAENAPDADAPVTAEETTDVEETDKKEEKPDASAEEKAELPPETKENTEKQETDKKQESDDNKAAGTAETADRKEDKKKKSGFYDKPGSHYKQVLFIILTVLLIIVILIVLLVIPGGKKGKEQGADYMEQIRNQEIRENDVAAVDAFFNLYYTALSSGNTTALEDMYDDPSRVNITTEISTIVNQYDNIQVYVTPGIGENDIVAFVYNDIHFANIDATAPSVDSFYLTYDESEAALKIRTDMYTDPDILRYMNLVSYRDPIRSLLSDTNDRLSATLADNKDLNNLYILMQSMLNATEASKEEESKTTKRENGTEQTEQKEQTETAAEVTEK